MTEEELKQEARKLYIAWERGYCKEPIPDLLVMFAEPSEKRIAELKAQIEKMKCPQNCKNGSVYNWSDNSICMDCEKVSTLHEDNWQEMCKGCKCWELRR